MLSKTEDQAEVDNDDDVDADDDDYVDGYKNECCYRASWRWLEKKYTIASQMKKKHIHTNIQYS